jgi:hypothetical protein
MPIEISDIVPLPAISDPRKARVMIFGPGKLGHAPLDQIGLATVDMVVAAGGGDMAKSVYDTNNNGRVNFAELADSVTYANVTGKPSTFPPTLPIAESDVTGLVADLALKAPLASPTLTGTPAAPTAGAGTATTQLATTAFVGAAITASGAPAPATVAPLMDGVAAVGTTTKYAREDHKHPVDTSREPTISAGTTAQYWKGDKSWATLDKTAVGLANVDNTADTAKPVSTAQQTALNLKADLAGPVFTGDARAVTPATSDNDTSIATTAYVKAQGYAKCTVSSTAPSSPATGDLWVDTT